MKMKNLKIRQFILSIALLNTTDAMKSEKHTKALSHTRIHKQEMLRIMTMISGTLVQIFKIRSEGANELTNNFFINFVTDVNNYYQAYCQEKTDNIPKDDTEILKSLKDKYNIIFPQHMDENEQLQLLAIIYNLWSKVLFKNGDIKKIPCYFDLNKLGLRILKECEVCKPDKSEIFEALLTLPVEEKLLQIFYRFDAAMDWHNWVRSWLSIINLFANYIKSVGIFMLPFLREYNEVFLQTWLKVTEQKFADHCVQHNIDNNVYTEGLKKIKDIAKLRLKIINNELDQLKKHDTGMFDRIKLITQKPSETEVIVQEPSETEVIVQEPSVIKLHVENHKL